MKPTRLTIILFLLAAFILGGCNLAGRASPTPTQLPTTSPEPSPIPATSTPEPAIAYLQLTERARFISIEPLIEMLNQLAAEEGMQFQQGGAGDPIPDRAAVIVTTGEADVVQQALEGAAGANVVALGTTSLESGDRLTVIGPNGFRFERAAFLAGYIGAMLIPDHRTGMLTASAGNANWQQAFRNGQQYYCGLCRPAYPPFNDYPVITSLPADFNEQAFSEAVNQIRAEQVGALYLPPLGSQDYLEWFDGEPQILLSALAPTAETATVTAVIRPAPEVVIERIWQDLQAGSAPPDSDMPLVIDQINSTQLNDARLRVVLEVLDDLNSGFIQPITAD